jgi:hypothetical protein
MTDASRDPEYISPAPIELRLECLRFALTQGGYLGPEALIDAAAKFHAYVSNCAGPTPPSTTVG